MREQKKYSGLPLAVILILAFTLLVKFILMPYAQTTDADAVSRTLDAMKWARHPEWIVKTVWGPFDFYLNGLMLMVWNDPIHAIITLHIVLSVLTLIPFFFFVKREFNEFGAIVTTAFLAICPILFRLSFMAMAEIPYLFFVVCSINFISKSLREKKNIYIVASGICMTLASGFRYEAWLLIAVFSLVIFLQGNWKKAFLFGITGCIFPAISILQNYLQNGHALFGISSNYNWTQNIMQTNLHVSLQDYLRRIWSFPFSWMIALGPLTAWFTIKAIFSIYKKSSPWHYTRYWTIPFWIFLIALQYNAFKGTLLLHHRFIATLVVLSLPFCAIYFDTPSVNKIRQAVIFGILTVGLTFVYNTGSIVPLPRLRNQSAAKVAGIIRPQINSNSGLIVDSWGDWENTYYIALQSGLHWRNMVLLDPTTHENTLPAAAINKVLQTYPQGVILLIRNSALYKNTTITNNTIAFGFNSLHLKTEQVFSNDTLTVLKYSVE